VTGALLVAAGSGLSLAIALQDMPVPEKVTLLGLLAFIIGSVTWLLRSIGGRLVDSVDNNTKTVGGLVTELHVLTEQNAAFQREATRHFEEYARERDKAVDELKRAIEAGRRSG